jgi:hypothetical protein
MMYVDASFRRGLPASLLNEGFTEAQVTAALPEFGSISGEIVDTVESAAAFLELVKDSLRKLSSEKINELATARCNLALLPALHAYVPEDERSTQRVIDIVSNLTETIPLPDMAPLEEKVYWDTVFKNCETSTQSSLALREAILLVKQDMSARHARYMSAMAANPAVALRPVYSLAGFEISLMIVAARLRNDVRLFTRMGYTYVRKAIPLIKKQDNSLVAPPQKELTYAEGKRIPKRAAPGGETSKASQSGKRPRPESGEHCDHCNRDSHSSADCRNTNPDCNDTEAHPSFKHSPKGKAWAELGVFAVPFNVDLKGNTIPGRTPGKSEIELANRIKSGKASATSSSSASQSKKPQGGGGKSGKSDYKSRGKHSVLLSALERRVGEYNPAVISCTLYLSDSCMSNMIACRCLIDTGNEQDNFANDKVLEWHEAASLETGGKVLHGVLACMVELVVIVPVVSSLTDPCGKVSLVSNTCQSVKNHYYSHTIN